MMDATKYQIGYYPPPVEPGHVYEWMQKDHIETAPAWCSVDLRDGNQSLVVPMSLEEKLEFYEMLLKIGFKEIEVGFPAASETEYEFLRKLIDEDRIPQDVTIHQRGPAAGGVPQVQGGDQANRRGRCQAHQGIEPGVRGQFPL